MFSNSKPFSHLPQASRQSGFYSLQSINIESRFGSSVARHATKSQIVPKQLIIGLSLKVAVIKVTH